MFENVLNTALNNLLRHFYWCSQCFGPPLQPRLSNSPRFSWLLFVGEVN
jgi:hypothetical protein